MNRCNVEGKSLLARVVSGCGSIVADVTLMRLVSTTDERLVLQ